MSDPAPQIDCERFHASVFVDDVARAVDFYTTRLGFTQAFVFGDMVFSAVEGTATEGFRLGQVVAHGNATLSDRVLWLQADGSTGETVVPAPRTCRSYNDLAVTVLALPSTTSCVAAGMVTVASSAVTRTTPQVPRRS